MAAVLATIAALVWVLLPSSGTTEETRRMTARLAQIADQADPALNKFLNSKRAARLRRELQQLSGPQHDAGLLQYARELLRAGETQVATLELRELLFRLVDGQDETLRRDAQRVLAIAYLRLGEEQNCIRDSNADSCIIPLKGGAIHQQSLGASAAIAEYQDLLERYPDDTDSLWLLNVAYMALGKYPDGVPEQWLFPPERLASPVDPGRFINRAPAFGLDLNNSAGGVVADDLDGDHDLDLLLSGWGLTEQLRYFRNDGGGRFIERTIEAGLTGIVGGLNMVHADYDNDGDNDVLVLRGAWLGGAGHHPNSLLRNRGDGRFDDVTESAGLLSFRPTQTAVWADFDNDGWLDLFIGNESRGNDPHPCELYRNNRDGTFSDRSAVLGFSDCGVAKGAVSGDFDNDGRQDLYVSRQGAGNLLLGNRISAANGPWRFAEHAARAGASEPRASFPAWVWDYDHDGWLDIFVSGFGTRLKYSNDAFHAGAFQELTAMTEPAGDGSQRRYVDTTGRPYRVSRLYRNRGDGTFADQTEGSGLAQPFWTMGCNFGDIDNDGRLDMYLGTGAPDFRALTPNRMFRGDGAGRFQDVTTAVGVGHLQKGHAIVFVDLDNDGDQDIYANLGGAWEADTFRNALFVNPGHGHAWVTLKLQGTRANRSAIGARIKLVVETPNGRRTLHHHVSTGSSFGSGSLQQEIGLGDATGIVSVTVTWPGGDRVQVFDALPMRRIWRLIEGQDKAEEIRLPPFDLAMTLPTDADPESPRGSSGLPKASGESYRR